MIIYIGSEYDAVNVNIFTKLQLFSQMWMEVSGARKKMEAHPGYYKSLLDIPLNEDLMECIKVDLPRTFPDNIYFRDYKEGKLSSLNNVLVAFSNHNKKIGYCQVSVVVMYKD